MMKEKAKASARAVEKIMVEQKSKAISKAQALGIGGLTLILGFGLVVFGTTEAVAPTQAQALVVKEQKKEATLKKYENAHTLTDTELVELLRAIGFEGKDLQEAWAVAKKESNGRPLAHNGNIDTGDNSWGMFQINMLGELGQSRRDKFGLKSNAELLNPVVNATIAYYMSDGGKNWNAWHGITPKTEQLMDKFLTVKAKQ
jgi:hypothetical protein